MSKQKVIVAGMVLFNPDNEERFYECVNSILSQVEKLYVFDNSTTRQSSYMFPEAVVYMCERKNKGVAYALNRIIERAGHDGYKWVVTVDQDSILPSNMIAECSNEIGTNNDLGIICPQVIDSRRIYMIPKTSPCKEYINECITSASCTSVDAWEKIGGFDEWLFVDLVDNDFCKRLVCSGYKILRLNTLILNQEFGKIIPKSPKKQFFWLKLSKILHNKNIAKFSYYKTVSPIRVYYTCRNILYLNKKFKGYGGIGYKENYNCNTFFGFLVCFVVPSILRAEEKFKTMNAVVAGFRDGSKKRVVPWEAVDNI